MSVDMPIRVPKGVSPRGGRAPREIARVPAAANDAAPTDWPRVERAFRAGDAAAAVVVAGELAPWIAQLIGRLVAWRYDAEDLVQDVLVTALEGRMRFRGDASLRTWITRIAVNKCRAHQRKQWLRRKLWRGWAERDENTDNIGEAADARAIADEQAAAVRAAIARLPNNYREAIVLHYLENMPVTEAAASLGVRRGTFEVRLSRARGQLRELLSGESP
jgi:RNA polymerase sigma-70 factor (ECF subfamily)